MRPRLATLSRRPNMMGVAKALVEGAWVDVLTSLNVVDFDGE